MNTRDLLAKHSLRCTRQRMAVYEALVAFDGHPTAEELFRLARTHQTSLQARLTGDHDRLSSSALAPFDASDRLERPISGSKFRHRQLDLPLRVRASLQTADIVPRLGQGQLNLSARLREPVVPFEGESNRQRFAARQRGR